MALAARLRDTGNVVVEKHYPGIGHPGTLLALGSFGRQSSPGARRRHRLPQDASVNYSAGHAARSSHRRRTLRPRREPRGCAVDRALRRLRQRRRQQIRSRATKASVPSMWAASTPIDAIEACKAALDEDPSNIQLMAWLGNAYAADNQASMAVPLLEPAAAAGNVVALRALGDLLILGKGIGQDKLRGVDLLHQSAAQGFAPASSQPRLLLRVWRRCVRRCRQGDGVRTSRRPRRRSARAAHRGRSLSARYRRCRRRCRAFGWLQRAADAGDPEAQLPCSALPTSKGAVLSPSIDDALAAFRGLVRRLQSTGSTALGYMTELGLGIEVDRAGRAAASITPDASANIAVAMHNLARLRTSPRTLPEMPAYALRGSRQGRRALRAAVNLALMLLQGTGGPQDIAGALRVDHAGPPMAATPPGSTISAACTSSASASLPTPPKPAGSTAKPPRSATSSRPKTSRRLGG